MSTIAMGIRSPDIVGQLARSAQAAGVQNNVMRENRLMQLYRDQGAGIAAGEEGALAALAQHNPQQAVVTHLPGRRGLRRQRWTIAAE